MNKKLTVVAMVQALPGNELEMSAILKSFVAPTLQEEGCLQYVLHQSQEDAAKFLFYETWVSKEALECHLQSSHIQGALPRIKDLWVQPLEITFWD